MSCENNNTREKKRFCHLACFTVSIQTAVFLTVSKLFYLYLVWTSSYKVGGEVCALFTLCHWTPELADLPLESWAVPRWFSQFSKKRCRKLCCLHSAWPVWVTDGLWKHIHGGMHLSPVLFVTLSSPQPFGLLSLQGTCSKLHPEMCNQSTIIYMFS